MPLSDTGDSDFPSLAFAGLSGVATYPPGATFGPRVMRDYEFVWLIEGDATYTWADQTIDAPQGSIVLCRPGATDFFRWDPSRNTRHGYVHFTLDRVPRAWGAPEAWPLVRRFGSNAGDRAGGVGTVATAVGTDDIIFPMFRHLLAWAGTGDATIVRLSLAHILGTYVTGQTTVADVPREPLPEPVERALAFLHDALDSDAATPVSFAQLTDAACVTGPHLCRLFKSATGHTPAETVRLARLDRAHALVVRSNYSVKEIARMTGFASPFHFTRLFTRAFGVAPAMLRKRIEAGELPPHSRLIEHWPRRHPN
jgi:AraC family transcriptional regulator